MSDPPPDSHAARVYALGMRYIQQAFLFRSQGNATLSASFQAKFFALCDTIASSGLAEAAHIPADDTIAALADVNDGRLRLMNEAAAMGRDPSALAVLHPALSLATASCKTLTQCLIRGEPPPPLDSRICHYPRPILNEGVPEEQLQVEVLRLAAKPVRGRLFQLATDAKTAATDPFPSGEDIRAAMSVRAYRKGAAAEASARRTVPLSLVALSKRVFGKPDAVPVASLTIPLSIFEARATVTRDFAMESAPIAKDEHFVISLCLRVRAGLVRREFEQRSEEYRACAALDAPEPVAPVAALVAAVAPGRATQGRAPAPQRAAQQRATLPAARAPPAAAAKSVKDLAPADQKRVMDQLKALHLLEDWEKERFMALSVLKSLVEERNQIIALCIELGLAPLAKIVAERDALAKRKDDLLAALTVKKSIPVAEYRARVTAQLSADAQEISKRGKDSPEAAPLLARLRIAKQEVDSWKK